MREMALNRASLSEQGAEIVAPMFAELARGMAALVNQKVAAPLLRMQSHLYEIGIGNGDTLYDTLNRMQSSGRFVEEVRFLRRLAQKVPLLADLPHDVGLRFHGCEGVGEPRQGTEVLVFCVIGACVAISFPTSPAWDRDQLTVLYRELLENGDLEEISDVIDNLARTEHASGIIERHRRRGVSGLSAASFWALKESIFPDLLFAPGVREQVEALDQKTINMVGYRLEQLDNSIREWRNEHAVLRWQCNVTGESETTMSSPPLVAARTFLSVNGQREVFEWHARFGGAGRIHLRIQPSSRTAEIGYIGPHLPLAT